MSYIAQQKYINWDTLSRTPELKFLYSKDTCQWCQEQIRLALKEMYPERPSVLVTEPVIQGLLFSVFEDHKQNFRRVGDIYTRYIQPIELQRNDVQEILEKVVRTAVNQIRTEWQTIENNQKLTVWNTLYGEHNPEGLRAHPTIKINHRRPPTQIHMRY